MWKPPNVEGRRGRCWELKGETKEGKKNPGRRSANTDRKRRVGSLTGTGRAGEQERGGVSPHTQRKPDFGSGSCKREPAQGEGRHVLHGTMEKKEYHMLHGMTGKKEYGKTFWCAYYSSCIRSPPNQAASTAERGGLGTFSITPNWGRTFNYNRGSHRCDNQG